MRIEALVALAAFLLVLAGLVWCGAKVARRLIAKYKEYKERRDERDLMWVIVSS